MIQLAEMLNIFTVADEWAKETPEITRFAWLVCMAMAIFSEPPALLLRPDDSWGRLKPQRSGRSQGIDINDDTWGSSILENPINKKHRQQFKRILNPPQPPVLIPYEKENSRLARFAKPLSSTNEPQNLCESSFREMIHRDDFHNWCTIAGHSLPRFWFADKAKEGSTESHSQNNYKSLESRLLEVVFRLFWSAPPPEGHSRPTKELITDWLMIGYKQEGLTRKGAERIITMSWPENIPKHGNIPQTLKKFPVPHYP